MFWKLSADLVSAQFKVARQAYAQCRDLIRIHVDKINEADGKKNNGGNSGNGGDNGNGGNNGNGGDNGGNNGNGGDNGGNSGNGGDNGNGNNGNGGNSGNGGDNGGNQQQNGPLTAEEQKEYDKLINIKKKYGKLGVSERKRLEQLEAKKNAAQQTE